MPVPVIPDSEYEAEEDEVKLDGMIGEPEVIDSDGTGGLQLPVP